MYVIDARVQIADIRSAEPDPAQARALSRRVADEGQTLCTASIVLPARAPAS